LVALGWLESCRLGLSVQLIICRLAWGREEGRGGGGSSRL